MIKGLPLLVIEEVKFWIFISQFDFRIKSEIKPILVIKYIKKFIHLAYKRINERDKLISDAELLVILRDNNPVVEAIIELLKDSEIEIMDILISLNELHELFNKENFFKEQEVYRNIVN